MSADTSASVLLIGASSVPLQEVLGNEIRKSPDEYGTDAATEINGLQGLTIGSTLRVVIDVIDETRERAAPAARSEASPTQEELRQNTQETLHAITGDKSAIDALSNGSTHTNCPKMAEIEMLDKSAWARVIWCGD
ncbi:unnamed protein product [Rhizoctonia solani]|uniref:Uncharacterized protein n=1 Tax=Rhizoctonia solani TaxID=456999 RepID=A0A8H3B7V6_9AGAM|nr:unnamed protein product [Rhizoctonia solani]